MTVPWRELGISGGNLFEPPSVVQKVCYMPSHAHELVDSEVSSCPRANISLTPAVFADNGWYKVVPLTEYERLPEWAMLGISPKAPMRVLRQDGTACIPKHGTVVEVESFSFPKGERRNHLGRRPTKGFRIIGHHKKIRICLLHLQSLWPTMKRKPVELGHAPVRISSPESHRYLPGELLEGSRWRVRA